MLAAMPLSPRSIRRLLPLSTLLLVAACEPLSCQGRVTDGINQVAVDDTPAFPPLCVNNGTDFIGDVNITQQAQLDQLSACLRVKGNIFIHDSTDITSLGALAKLERIDAGYLNILNNAALTEVSLPALTDLEAGFAAIDNPELVRVLLPGITTLKGDLTLRNNAKLTQLDFKAAQRLNNAVFVINAEGFLVSHGNLILADLPSLTSIDGAFDALQVIEGSVDVHNTGLTSFKGLETLTDILNTGGAGTVRTKFRADKLNPGLSVGIDFDDEFNIVASGNPALKNFDGLQNLNVIVGDVFVGFNPTLENFVGLDDLTTINGRLFVAGNDELLDFSGFDGDNDGDGADDGLSAINGDLFIGQFFDSFNQPVAGGNASLKDFSGLDSLTTLTGNLVLAFSPQFETFNGLDLLPAIGKDFVMLGLEPDDFKGALVLTTVGGNLTFGQLLRNDGQPFDPAEEDPTLQLVDVAGVVQNPGVKFDTAVGENGFEALTTVNGNLIFAFSDFSDYRLSDQDTANLATVGKSLIVYGNANPDTLAGIQTVGTLGGFVVNFAVDAFGDLQPFENNGLADFSNLAVNALGVGGLHIGFNGDIDDAAFASFPNFGNVAGSVTLARVVEQNNLGPSNLAQLNVVTIGGDLNVCAIKNGDTAPINADLGNLTALNLPTTTVTGSVFVGFCSDLANTTMALNTVGGTLEFTELPSLVTINGLGDLDDVGEALFHDLSDVETIALPALATVLGNLEVIRNPSLTAVDFGALEVDGTVRFAELDDLPNLAGLANLTEVGGDLDIIDCPAVLDTIGLNNLTTVGGTLRLRRLDSLVNEVVAGGNGDQGLTLNSLTTVNNIEILEMQGLDDLAGLEGIPAVQGTLTIAGNPNLKTLFGLQGLTSIGRKLSIIDNPELELAFFDDDDLDRDEDKNVAQNDDVEDDIFEAGLLTTLLTIGEPEVDSGVVIGGRTGIIELRNNPLLDEAAVVDLFIEELNNYEGLLFFCGNVGSVDAVDAEARLTSFAVCPGAQDGVTFPATE